MAASWLNTTSAFHLVSRQLSCSAAAHALCHADHVLSLLPCTAGLSSLTLRVGPALPDQAPNRLTALPHGLSKLTRLRHLDLNHAANLDDMAFDDDSPWYILCKLMPLKVPCCCCLLLRLQLVAAAGGGCGWLQLLAVCCVRLPSCPPDLHQAPARPPPPLPAPRSGWFCGRATCMACQLTFPTSATSPAYSSPP